MGAAGLSSRAIIGSFYELLEQNIGQGWLSSVAMPFSTDQASEKYVWLGQTPVIREWIGGRIAKALRENNLTIINKKYEATLRVELDDIRRDKTGQGNAQSGNRPSQPITDHRIEHDSDQQHGDHSCPSRQNKTQQPDGQHYRDQAAADVDRHHTFLPQPLKTR